MRKILASFIFLSLLNFSFNMNDSEPKEGNKEIIKKTIIIIVAILLITSCIFCYFLKASSVPPVSKSVYLKLKYSNKDDTNELLSNLEVYYKNSSKIILSFSEVLRFPEITSHMDSALFLDIKNNLLSSLPESIKNLKNLRFLDISFNNFTEFPKHVCGLPSLKVLMISSNLLKSLPETLEVLKLENLETLDLSKNEIKIIPYWFKDLKRLRVLNLSENKIAELPQWISELKNLEVLNINGIEVSKIPEWISDLPNIKELNINNCNIKRLPKSFEKLKDKLEKLEISSNFGSYENGEPNEDFIQTNDTLKKLFGSALLLS